MLGRASAVSGLDVLGVSLDEFFQSVKRAA
jgi:hypothetical protein